MRHRHNFADHCPECVFRCRFAPRRVCPRHPAFEVDYCPGCGTGPRI